jgi:quercetin 2,3-dioxygenase
MKTILSASKSQKIRRGLFNIDLYFPGRALKNPDDPNGLLQLGRFDFAHLLPGVFVGMHPHRDDEILTYMRQGTMIHEDTHGERELISATHLMLMNAGTGIYHQESIPAAGEEVKLLQIFIRPERSGLIPRVQFSSFDSPVSINQWRVVAGHQDVIPKAPLLVQSQVIVSDCRLEKSGISIVDKKDKVYVLFVFDGELEIEDYILRTGDALISNGEEIHVFSSGVSDLVLFELDENGTYTTKGMYSGAL